MKIAYLVSLYPAPSHTFIERELRALEASGIEILRFSVRRPKSGDIVDETARSEGSKVRWLVPAPIGPLLAALAWNVFTHPVRLFSTLKYSLSKANGLRNKLRWLAYWVEGILLAYWMTLGGAEHLHCHFGNSGSNTAMIAAQLAGLPFSITFHGIDLDEPELFRHGDKLQHCAFAVCISDNGRQILLRNGPGVDASKVHTIRCGYALPVEQMISPLPGNNHIVCVARLSPEKGHGILLDALQILHERHLPFSCTLVGGGPLGSQIKDRIEGTVLKGLVTVVGTRSPAEVREFIAQADVAVLASFGEGIPIVLMEAFAQKRPVVATNVGGIPELLSDWVNGRLVAPGDPIGFADAVESILRDHRAAEEMGQAGWDVVTAKHDPRKSTEQLHRLLAQSVQRRRAEAGNQAVRGRPDGAEITPKAPANHPVDLESR
jgi:colanic acid/amylovoran biosynthesis glycosyltransferase